MRVRRLFAVVATAALAGAAAGTAAEGEEPRASASAFGVLVRLAAGETFDAGSISAPPDGSANLPGFRYPAAGDVVSVGSIQTDVATGPGAAARSRASTVVRDVDLFGGALTLDAIALTAEARAARDGAAGDLSGSSVSGLRVAGQPVAAVPNQRIPLGDWGYAVVLEQAVARGDDEEHAYRGFVVGVHVHLTAEHAGLPAGAEVLVGYAEAATRWPIPPTELPGESAGGGGDAAGPGEQNDGSGAGAPGALPDEPTVHPPGSQQTIPAIVRDPPPGVRPDITGKGYVFPVYGPASFSSDFGYPRALTGWHHGNDIFAPLGAPILAVADGTLFSVGWNQVGGWRLWLRDGQGNEYYYAHLSAYSPLAENGVRVRAGDVIGFVGDTGDARGTPPHLHFEIHPAALLGLGYDGVIDPYGYLLSWQSAEDLAISVAPGQAEVGSGPAPEPGAALLDVQDISSHSGLVPGLLEEALGLPLLVGESAPLVPVTVPGLVGAAPGFS